MSTESELQCAAFVGSRLVASGGLEQVALAVKAVLDREPASALVFDDDGKPIELDLRGSEQDVVSRLRGRSGPPPGDPAPTRRGPGRPKLGVQPREVTLLPRHWDWLNAQPGGASVALRKLVDEARRASHGPDRVRRAQEAAYRFMAAVAGNEPGYEDATRALFAADRARFDALTSAWPADVSAHAAKLAASAFEAPAG